MILSILAKLRQLKPGNDEDEKRTEKRGSIQEMVTKEFQEFLENKVKEMFPDMLSTFYFVPPVYFNKIRYKTQSLGDEVAYVPDLPDSSEAKHDRAMLHVLHCLRHMAEQQQQQMFVLTQFRYEDYLSSPGNDFAKHKLPVPAGLKGADKRTKCFDILIFHRSLGVMVAVVKPVTGDVNDSPEDQQKLASLLVTEVSDAIQQLKKADLMLKHLMSDREKLPTIRGTIILPNLAKSLLQKVIDCNVKLHENLRECLGATADETPVDLCLCAEQLSASNTPWDVSSDVVSNVQQWIEKLMRRTVDGESMWEELYVGMIARLCGPATKSTLQVPNGSAPFVLPKTLDETVSLTGQIIEGPIIYSDMADLVTSPKAFLSGPPNTGKTRMLTLVGRKWLSSGHDVFILNDVSSKSDSFLSEHLQALASPDAESTTKSASGTVYIEVCDFKKKPSEIVGRINSKRGEKTPHVLLDDVQLDQKNFTTLLEALLKGLPDLHLWVTSTTRVACPEGLPTTLLTRCLNSPPAVFREAPPAEGVYGKNITASEATNYVCPTDGPPVKYIRYEKSPIPWLAAAHDSKECGQKVGDFLTKVRLIAKSDQVETQADTTKPATQTESTVEQRSSLQCRDILVVFEREVKGDNNFLKGLRESGIAVNPVKAEKDKIVVTDDSDTSLAVTLRQLQTYRTKRKIVVYVESDSECKDVENKQRAITSCTSQLIVVRPG